MLKPLEINVRQNADGHRIYETPNGDYLSITSFLDKYKSPEKAEALQKWREEKGEEEAERIRVEAAEYGTELHEKNAEFFRLRMNGELGIYGLGKNNQKLFTILNGITFPKLVEYPVFHDGLRLAGTSDLLSYWNPGVFESWDWKTSLKPKKLDWIEDYLKQVSFYALATEERYPQIRGKITHASVVVDVRDKPNCQHFRINRGCIEDCFLNLVDQVKESGYLDEQG